MNQVSDKVREMVEDISNLKLIDVVVLVDELKKRLNLPDIAFAIPSAQGTAQSNVMAHEKEEKSKFDLVLKSAGEKKTQVIKAMKDVMKKLGKELSLKELKDLVESSPVKVAEDLSKEDADDYLKILSESGADVELK